MTKALKPLIYEELFINQQSGDLESNIREYIAKLNEDKCTTSELKAYSERLSLIQNLEWINTPKEFNAKTDLKKRIVLVDFWTYCCINCMHVIPLLNQLENEFKQLLVVGVHSSKFENEKSKSNILSAIKRHLIKHPVVLDLDLKLWTSLEVVCWPTLLVLDPNGLVIAEFKGEVQSHLIRTFLKVAFQYYSSQIIGDYSTKHKGECIKSKISNESQTYDESTNLNELLFPTKMCLVAEQSLLFISDSGNNRILAVDTESRKVKYAIGSGKRGWRDGHFAECEFDWPQGLAYDSSISTLYIADTFNDLVRAANLATRQVTRLCGTIRGRDDATNEYDYDYVGGKQGLEQSISSPWDVCLLERGPYCRRVLLIACAGTHQIWLYSIRPVADAAQNVQLDYLSWWKSKPQIEWDTLVCIAGNGKERNKNNSYPMQASFAQPSGLGLSLLDDNLYVADAESSTIRVLSLKDGSVKSLVGGDPLQPDNLFAYGDSDGIGSEAKLQHPLDVRCYLNPKQSENEFVLVADTYNNCLKKIDIKKKRAEKLISTNEQLNEPNGICIDLQNERLFIADTNNHSIKLINQFNVNSQHVTMEEFKIKFSNTENFLPTLDGLVIAKPNEYQLCCCFRFKLNLNAQNTWKIIVKGVSSPLCVSGAFKASDWINHTTNKDSHVYKLDNVFIDKSSKITHIQIDFNLIYCESDSSCKIFKKSINFNNKEISKMFSPQKFTEQYILLKIN